MRDLGDPELAGQLGRQPVVDAARSKRERESAGLRPRVRGRCKRLR